jgi:tRNA threonylcarbamoyladenosine biosynthesis protein TsaE
MQVGYQLAARFVPGSVVALIGDLGAGKTTLAKGIAQRLTIEEQLTSPTFTLISTYTQGQLPLHHVDLYRIDLPAEVEDLGLDELMSGDGVTLIEWGEKAESLLPEETIRVRIALEGTTRVIAVTGSSE